MSSLNIDTEFPVHQVEGEPDTPKSDHSDDEEEPTRLVIPIKGALTSKQVVVDESQSILEALRAQRTFIFHDGRITEEKPSTVWNATECLVDEKGRYIKTERTKYRLVYENALFDSEDIKGCYSVFGELKSDDIKVKTYWKYRNNGNDIPCTIVDVSLKTPFKKITSTKRDFKVNGVEPSAFLWCDKHHTEIKVITTMGAAKSMVSLPETKSEQKGPETIEEIKEKVKDCLLPNDIDAVAITQTKKRQYLEVWKDHFGFSATIDVVSSLRTQKDVRIKYQSSRFAEEAVRIWKTFRGNMSAHVAKSLDDLYPWQKQWAQYLLADGKPGQARKICWLADYYGNSQDTEKDKVGKGGNIGKSELMKFMKYMAPDDVHIVSGCPNVRNLATILKAATEHGWTGKTIIFDISRSFSDWDIYETIENVSNGVMTATKYEGGTFSWAAVNIFFMSNWLPKTNGLSTDRWFIFRAVDPVPYDKTKPRGAQVEFQRMELHHVESERERLKMESQVLKAEGQTSVEVKPLEPPQPLHIQCQDTVIKSQRHEIEELKRRLEAFERASRSGQSDEIKA